MDFTILDQLGNNGKDGKTYRIKVKRKYYAMKKFKNKI